MERSDQVHRLCRNGASLLLPKNVWSEASGYGENRLFRAVSVGCDRTH